MKDGCPGLLNSLPKQHSSARVILFNQKAEVPLAGDVRQFVDLTKAQSKTIELKGKTNAEVFEVASKLVPIQDVTISESAAKYAGDEFYIKGKKISLTGRNGIVYANGGLIAAQIVLEDLKETKTQAPVRGYPGSTVVFGPVWYDDAGGSFRIISRGLIIRQDYKVYLESGKRIPISSREVEILEQDRRKRQGYFEWNVWQWQWLWFPGTEQLKPPYIDPNLA